MPTQGSSIPVLSVEKLWLDNDGRGLNVHWDGTNYFSGACAGVSGGTTGANTFLPAVSSCGWLRIQAMSGTAGTTQTGYIPVYSTHW